MKLVTRTYMKGCSELSKEEKKKIIALRNNDCTIIKYISHTWYYVQLLNKIINISRLIDIS